MFPDNAPAVVTSVVTKERLDAHKPTLLEESAQARFRDMPNRNMLVIDPVRPTKMTGFLPIRSELQN